MAARSSILHMSVYLQPPGSVWLHGPVFYTCLFIYSHLDPYGCTVQYSTHVCLFTATWIRMAARSSILHMSVYLQPPGSVWLHGPVFYTCLFIYSHLDPYGCTVQYSTHVCLFTATWIRMAAPSSILHMSVYLQPPGSVWLHRPVFYTCLFIYSHLDPYGCTIQYSTRVCLFTATWICMAARSSILHSVCSIYSHLDPYGWICPVFYTCLFIYSHLDPYGCTVQYSTCVCLFTATWIRMAAPSSILHMSVYLQPPGSVWLHRPVFYTCLFIYSHLDPYGCTVQYLDAAFRNIYNHGVMVITATDVAALYGELLVGLCGEWRPPVGLNRFSF